MKLEHFHYLLEISRLHSISAAARALHIGQTTLSAIVKVAEEEVGFPIFQRTPNGVLTTPHGERLMALAWEINVKYEELMSLKRRIDGGAPPITILLSPTVSYRVAIPLVNQFSRFDLHGDLTFEEIPGEFIGEQILENSANLGVAFLSQEEIEKIGRISQKDTLVVEKLLPDRICLLVGHKHRLANSEVVDVSEVCKERIATAKAMTNDKVLGQLIDRCARVTTFSDMDNVYQAVRDQDMVAFMPTMLRPTFIPGQSELFRTVELTNPERSNNLFLCLITCQGRKLRYQEKLLAACIREYFSEWPTTQRADEEQKQGGAEQ